MAHKINRVRNKYQLEGGNVTKRKFSIYISYNIMINRCDTKKKPFDEIPRFFIGFPGKVPDWRFFHSRIWDMNIKNVLRQFSLIKISKNRLINILFDKDTYYKNYYLLLFRRNGTLRKVLLPNENSRHPQTSGHLSSHHFNFMNYREIPG